MNTFLMGTKFTNQFVAYETNFKPIINQFKKRL